MGRPGSDCRLASPQRRRNPARKSMPSALPDFVRVELAEWRVSKYASMSEGPARADGHAADGDVAGGIGCYDVNSSRRHRRSVRLAGYDYSQPGAYFVTICAQDRTHFFGEVVGGQMHLNEPGRMIVGQWTALPQRFPVVCLDAFVVMPNHLHGILIIRHVGAPLVGDPRLSVCEPRLRSCGPRLQAWGPE